MKKERRNGPFVIKSSEVKYKNPWIEVVEDKVIRPDGKDGLFGVVNYGSGISILPLDSEENVYLIKEFHYALGEADIATVSGGTEDDESVEEAAKRELEEEAGIKAEKITDLGVVHPYTTIIRSSAHLFLAEDLKFVDSRQEDGEDIEMIKMPFWEAFQLVMSGSIVHAPSCVLILKAWLHLQNTKY